jgi:ribosome biogenesis GTPase
VQKDWVKGNRDRAPRLDADPETIVGGREKIRPKAITIDDVSDIDELPRGQVIVAESGRYDVKEERTGDVIACRIKRGASTENERSTLVTVGDFVRIQPLDKGRGLIHHIEERRSHLGRDAAGREVMEHVIAANVDLLLCVVAADRPDFRRTIIDRYIVAALLGEVTPIIILNKMDTVEGELEELLREEMAIYDQLGYQMLFTSAMTGEGIDELRSLITNRTSALVGHSGVGKSALTNILLGEDLRRTGEVREKDRRGMHTTISAAMVPLPVSGYLIDTPGIREFGIWDLEPEELDAYFVELLKYHHDCKYLPCTHTHEPGCAVIAAVERGDIDEGRYASYLAIFDSLKKVHR